MELQSVRRVLFLTGAVEEDKWNTDEGMGKESLTVETIVDGFSLWSQLDFREVTVGDVGVTFRNPSLLLC